MTDLFAQPQPSQDTPGNPASQPGIPGPDQGSVENLMFGDDLQVDPFGQPEVTAPQDPQGTPAAPEPAQEGEPAGQQPEDNAQVRYQYWQSQASKLQNRLQELEPYRPLIDQLKQNPTALAQMQSGQTAHQGTDQPQPEELTPPERPERPRSYSREEALTDPDSPSARYEEDVQSYQQELIEYQAQKMDQLQQRMLQKEQDEQEQRQQQQLAEQQRQQHLQQLNEVREYVKAEYGLPDDDAVEFVKMMSSGESLTVDNLVKLYRTLKGQGVPQGGQGGHQPSPEFQQMQRATQVPNPMGVQQGVTNPQHGKPMGENLMDTLVNEENGQNPFTYPQPGQPGLR